ncbi:MAG: hypothetical protein K0R54_814 [Clostridiaceae bacterium]|jgi:hypothetical protein|nr:hypothetical protein [Clostridiaceae bacterium]
MIFYHGTNSIALNQILKDGYIRPLSKTNQQNKCCITTTMQDDAVYLTSEKMIAGFYTPKGKVKVDNTDVYSCILEIDLPFEKCNFRPDEDYMNDIISYNNYDIYDKYIKRHEYANYVEPYISLFKNITKKDIDFRYLFSKNKHLGLKMLSESDSSLSLELGSVAYIGEIDVCNIKSVTISDIFEATIYKITQEEISNAIKKVDFIVDDFIDDIRIN